jgi:hypothetical protein
VIWNLLKCSAILYFKEQLDKEVTCNDLAINYLNKNKKAIRFKTNGFLFDIKANI